MQEIITDGLDLATNIFQAQPKCSTKTTHIQIRQR